MNDSNTSFQHSSMVPKVIQSAAQRLLRVAESGIALQDSLPISNDELREAAGSLFDVNDGSDAIAVKDTQPALSISDSPITLKPLSKAQLMAEFLVNLPLLRGVKEIVDQACRNAQVFLNQAKSVVTDVPQKELIQRLHDQLNPKPTT